MYSCASLAEARGCPIRIFTDQSLFAAPHDFSQRTTSFIASQCQGIHQMLLSRLMLSLPMSILVWSISLFPKPLLAVLGLMFRPASADGRMNTRSKKDLYVLDLPAAVRSSATSHVSQPRKAQSFSGLSPACLAFGPRKQIPSFTMSISKTHALSSGETGHTRSQRPNAGTTTLQWNGGARRDRTDDLKLAKLPLSQLSYGPVQPTKKPSPSGPNLNLVGLGRLELPTSRLSSARSNQLSYKPGTQGLTPAPKPSAQCCDLERKRNVDGGVPQMGL